LKVKLVRTNEIKFFSPGSFQGVKKKVDEKGIQDLAENRK